MLQNNDIFSTIPRQSDEGIALYVHNSLNINKISQFSAELKNSPESIAVKLIVENGKHLIVSYVYKSSGTNKTEFTVYIANLMSKQNYIISVMIT